MTSKWNMVYGWTIETDQLRLIVHRLYTDTRDQMCDDPRPQWEGLDEYQVTITELEVEYELVELKSGGSAKYRHEETKREITFNGDIRFVDQMRVIAARYNDFDDVVKAARVLITSKEVNNETYK